jgi:hypothetical protein
MRKEVNGRGEENIRQIEGTLRRRSSIGTRVGSEQMQTKSMAPEKMHLFSWLDGVVNPSIWTPVRPGRHRL